MTQDGRLARWKSVDVANVADVEAFAAMVAREAPVVDALICCAGAYGPIGRVSDVDPSEWWSALQANLFGTFLAIRRFAPMMTGGDGRIITFSGGGAFNPLPRYSAYASSKAAVVRLTETVAEEMKPMGISVNGVAPGFVRTEIHDATLAAGPEAAGPEFFAMTRAKLAEGAVPIEIPVDCVRFLLSPAARGLTGKTISANFDPWRSPVFQSHIEDLNASDLYTMRRMNLVNLDREDIVAQLADIPRDI